MVFTWTDPRLHHQPIGSMNFTNFMEGVLLIVSTGFAPGSIYGSTLFVHGFFAVCASLDPIQSRSFRYKAF